MFLQGKATFGHLSRYSHYHERTYSRGFRRDFDFIQFNLLGLGQLNLDGHTLVAAIYVVSLTKAANTPMAWTNFLMQCMAKQKKDWKSSR